jgi:hypothetical protein
VKRKLALLGLMAGVSIVSPYLLAVAARQWPNSAVARLHADLVNAESSNG